MFPFADAHLGDTTQEEKKRLNAQKLLQKCEQPRGGSGCN